MYYLNHKSKQHACLTLNDIAIMAYINLVFKKGWMKVKRFDYTAYLKGTQQMCVKLFSTVTSQSTLET